MLLVAQTREVASSVTKGISWEQYGALAVAVAVIVLPFVIGGFLAKKAKMPTYGTRFGLVLLAIIASAAVLLNKLPGLGVDLRGGTILVYEIDQSKNIGSNDQTGQRQKIISEDLIEPLSRRINPSGTQEIVIRPYGESQIEIIVPEVDQREVDRIKQVIDTAGILRFAILANRADHQRIIDLAIEQSESDFQSDRTRPFVQDVNGDVVGVWVRVDQEVEETDGIRPLRVNVGDAIVRNPSTGQLIDLPMSVRGEGGESKIVRWYQSQGLKSIETLMIIDPLLDVKGEDLAFAASTFDQNGAPAVAFNLTDAGSGKFFALTTNNAPKGTRQRQLGIVLDDTLLSAPNILQPIRKEGRITGNFTREEVDQLVQILKAGQLPAALTPQPIAENQIDATLGADTIHKGVFAIGSSLIIVLIFILFYYRFAGLVACIALMLNLAMILATMVLINQPLTLPGLAGLVLTVGMSVDANVLIFERIREELKKGAAARMAIRNGFSKATVTIVDANLTTLITAIVLYAIGTDQIRGFAVTLILGIVYSMFTAIYMSRTFFDVAERRGILTLSMSDGVNSLRSMLTSGADLDFMGKRKLALAISSLLMIVGAASIFARGKTMFDIDFAGGSSVQFRLDKPTETDTVRDIVSKTMIGADDKPIQYTVNGVSMDDVTDQTVYKVDSSFEKVEQLKAAISKAFAEEPSVNLVTYTINITATDPNETSLFYRNRGSDRNGTMLAVMRPQALPETTAEEIVETAAEETDTEGDSGPGELSAGEIVFSTSMIELGITGEEVGAKANAAALIESLTEAAETVGVPLNARAIELTPMGDGVEDWNPESSLGFSNWKIRLPLAFEQAEAVLDQVKKTLGNDPVWISSSSVGGQVAGDMIGRAFGALFGSLLCIIGYIWFRFQRVMYGLAAVAALLHDVLITLGAIAISYWLSDALGFLLIDPFKISLTVVAALLTIIGYSLNDTIVVFDRIRETKGKAPHLTSEMVNSSINQTLSRTLLTSLTTLLVVVLLYVLGGEGIHAFAFSLVVGVLVGTYSSVFVASPVLLWLIQRREQPKAA
ncbi:bifunctional preprotein translocase subunit SecD/SecF [Novipirellula aureliae]|uniref:Multifunctional fusion protein n=2 Tax=Novipirellula aureliae TaxID=2527966 RepID=A0A5C6EA22_9BACT|nr:bifunctional preprotein translocase subunit SecD/SecF [Novipirellula aureliae]